MKAAAFAALGASLIFSQIAGCQASLNAEANASSEGSASADAQAEGSGQAEGQGEMTRAADANASLASSEGAGITNLPASRVLLGARHDLKLRPGKGTANCQCLSVALGGSHNASMLWSAATPDIDETTQLTIALTSEGADCKGEPKGSLGASYWGYRISGNDVVVLVEAARGGRPLTSGAVIPRPVGTGQVFVAPASRQLPYGRPLDGGKLCKIGNPGQPRNAAFSELELGVNAPARATIKKGEPGSDPNDVPTTIEMPSN